MKSECGYRPDAGAKTLVYIPGSHAPAWEPIPVLDSATVCIPTQERGNEAGLHGAEQICGGGKPSTVGYALRTLYSFAGFIQ
jgi:hypothetical protein